MCVCAAMSSSLQPHGLLPTRLLCPWDFPDKNTGVGCHFLLQAIFPSQRLNPYLLHLLHWLADSLPLELPEKLCVCVCACVCVCVCVCVVSIHSRPCDQLVFIKLGLLMEIRKTGYKTICTLRFFCFCFCFCFTYKPSDSETPLSGSTTGKDWNQTRKYYKQVPLGDEITDYFFHLELFSFFRDYLLF